jgi:hypothetical protein
MLDFLSGSFREQFRKLPFKGALKGHHDAEVLRHLPLPLPVCHCRRSVLDSELLAALCCHLSALLPRRPGVNCAAGCPGPGPRVTNFKLNLKQSDSNLKLELNQFECQCHGQP